MTPSRRLAALFVLLTMSACGSTPQSTTPIVSASNRPSKLTIKVTGAVKLEYSGILPLQIVVTDAKNLAPNLRFRSIATSTPVSASGRRFIVGVNIIGTEGDGIFKIEPRPATPAPGVIPSIAFFQIFDTPTAPTTGPGRFDTNIKACSIEFKNAATQGHLSCPALRDSAKKSVSLDMIWAPA